MNRETRRQHERDERRAEQSGGPSAASGSGGWTRPAQFLREVRAELKKVAWPTRQEVINYSIVVLVVSLILTLFVAGLDWILRQATVNLFG